VGYRALICALARLLPKPRRIGLPVTLLRWYCRPGEAAVDLQAQHAGAPTNQTEDLNRRLSLGRRNDEFKELGETLNDLFGRLDRY
jgi:hypothetical protein